MTPPLAPPVPVVAPAAFTTTWLARLMTLAAPDAVVRLETADGHPVAVTGYRVGAGELVLVVEPEGGTG